MELEDMKKAVAHMKVDYNSVISVHSKRAIAKVYNEMKDKINSEERRQNAFLPTMIIDGQDIQIPNCMREDERYKFQFHAGLLYLIDRKKSLRKDEYPFLTHFTGTEFHWHSYAWIPNNGQKFTRLSVGMLGGDGYGDRAFVNAYHYKHPSDDMCYMETRVRLDSHHYRPFIEHILQEVTGWTLKHLKQS